MKQLLNLLEPDANAMVTAEAMTQLSIAISLKRIADAVTGSGDNIALTNMVQSLMWEAGRSFTQGQRTDR